METIFSILKFIAYFFIIIFELLGIATFLLFLYLQFSDFSSLDLSEPNSDFD